MFLVKEVCYCQLDVFRGRMHQSEFGRRREMNSRDVDLNAARFTSVWRQPVSLMKDQTT